MDSVALSVKNPPTNAGDMSLDPWIGNIPWRKKWQLTPLFLPGKLYDRGAWWATAHRVAKSQTQIEPLSPDCFHNL